jgi:hypothetical protein
MFFILTVTGGVFNTDRQVVFFILTDRWRFSHGPGQMMFFILTEPDDVFHTDSQVMFFILTDRWCFSY